MPQTYYTVLTQQGFAAFTNAAALGQIINITHMAVGDGNGQATTPQEQQTELVHQTYTGTLNLLTVQGDSQILAELVIPSSAGGWTIRELGLFDDAGHLLAVANFPPTYKPAQGEGTTSDLVLRMVVQVGNADVVNVTLDPSAVLATRDWVLQNVSARTVIPGGAPGTVLTKLYKADGSYVWRRLSTNDIDGLSDALESLQLPVMHDATNVTPADGAHGVIATPQLTGSDYFPLYGVTQHARHFQVIEQGGDYQTPAYEASELAQNGTPAVSHTVASPLNQSKPYAWRYRDENAAGEMGQWSTSTDFNTSDVYVATPSVTMPADGATDVSEQPVIQISDFIVAGGQDTQALTSVRIKDAGGNVVWQLIDSTDPLNNIVVPLGVLQDGQSTYTVEAKQSGATYGASEWSAPSAFTTQSQFVPDFNANIGMPYGGGYIAGEIVSDYDGNTYGLIVSGGEGDSVHTNFGSSFINDGTVELSYFFEVDKSFAGTPPSMLSDGYVNTPLMHRAPYNAAAFIDKCNADSGMNGYTDWYVPARDELDLVYRNFKPSSETNRIGNRISNTGIIGADGNGYGSNTQALPALDAHTEGNPAQTQVASFTSSDRFNPNTNLGYWSSTLAYKVDSQHTSKSWTQNFLQGGQTITDKSNKVYVRAVRRILLKEAS